MYKDIIECFKNTSGYKQHSNRLVGLTMLFGKRMNLNEEELNELSLLTTLHDIGKMRISESILNKPHRLTIEEWQEIKKHPEIGFEILTEHDELKCVANKVLYHHEKWDGTGYPVGLTGTEIPVLSRIIAITDAYDAMTTTRAYRQAKSRDEALVEICNYAGSQFDPELAKSFVELMSIDPYFLKY